MSGKLQHIFYVINLTREGILLKMDGGARGKFLKRTPKMCQNLSLWEWLEILLHPYEIPILKQQIFFRHISFGLTP